MPAKGADSLKLAAITKLLEDNPDGVWVREISRQLELSKSTVSRYLNSYLAGRIEEEWMGRNRAISR